MIVLARRNRRPAAGLPRTRNVLTLKKIPVGQDGFDPAICAIFFGCRLSGKSRKAAWKRFSIRTKGGEVRSGPSALSFLVTGLVVGEFSSARKSLGDGSIFFRMSRTLISAAFHAMPFGRYARSR
jgi:hypothetical protein